MSRFDPRNVSIVARKELRDALRSRWFALYALPSRCSRSGSRRSRSAGRSWWFRRVRTRGGGLVNLVVLIVPLMALTIGAQSIAGEAERGTLGLLLSQPVSRAEVLAGKFLGASIALGGTLAAGFGASGLILGARAAASVPRRSWPG